MSSSPRRWIAPYLGSGAERRWRAAEAAHRWRDGSSERRWLSASIGAQRTYQQTPSPGLANLSESLTLAGQTVQPFGLYLGTDWPGSGAWPATVGGDLSLVGSGSDPAAHALTPLGRDDRAVALQGGKGFASASAPTLSTCWIAELACRWNAAESTKYYIGCRATSSDGWALYSTGGTAWRVRAQAQGEVEQAALDIASSPVTAWVHVMLFFDPVLGQLRGIVNGQLTAGNLALTVGNYTGGKFVLGAATDAGGSAPTSGKIALAGLWVGASDWFDLSTDSALCDALALSRVRQLAGLQAVVAKGSDLPTAGQRNSTATLRRVAYGEVTRLFTMGPHWPRVDELRDARTDRDDPETVSNSFSFSSDLTQSSWTKANCAIGTGTGEALSNGRELQAIVADGSSNAHGVATALTPTSDWIHILSAKVRAGDKTACRLDSTNIFVDDIYQCYDLAAGTLGAATSGIIASGILSMSDAADLGVVPAEWASDTDSWLIWMAYYGGAFVHTHLLVPMTDASDPGSVVYTGDTVTEDIYATELQHDYMASDTPATQVLPRAYVHTEGAGRTLGKRVYGYLSEEARTNQLPTTIAGRWSQVSCTAVAAPGDGIGESDAYQLTDAVASSAHLVYRSRADTPAAGSAQQCMVWIKAGTLKYAVFEAQFGVGAASYAGYVINLLTGALTPYSSGTNPTVTPTVVNAGDGWWGINLAALWDGVSGSNKAVAVGLSNGNRSYLGTGTGTILAQFPQAEQGGFASSSIGSGTASSAARVKDELRVEAGANVGGESPRKLTVVTRLVIGAGRSGTVWSLSDGGSTPKGWLTIEASTGVARVRVDTAGQDGDVTGTTDLTDGIEHEIRVLLQANRLRLIVDGVEEGTADTSVDLLTGLDRWSIGHDETQAGQINALITHIEVWKGIKTA